MAGRLLGVGGSAGRRAVRHRSTRRACVRGAHREELAEVDEAVSACVDEVEQLLQLVLDHGLMANLPRGRE